MTLPRALLVLSTLLALGSCGEDGTAPRHTGDLRATVVSPDSADGAVLIELVGAVEGLSAPGADTLLTRVRGDTTWAFAARRGPGTFVFHFSTAPGESASGRILEVADVQDQPRSPSGHRLEISAR